VIAFAAAVAFAEEPPVVRPPVKEIDHPRYVDALGTPLTWDQIRDLAVGTDALARIRERRVGRTAVRLMFLSATALETWGTVELAQQGRWTAPLLGVQAGLTGLCGILSITSAPHDIQADHAIVLDAVNGALRRR
jgi:hypothetical protein